MHTICQRDADKEFVQAECVTLDEFFNEKERHIDVIKLDIEGAEMAALLGMDRITLVEGVSYTAEEFAHRLLEDWHFSILAMDDHTRNKKYLKINSVDELMGLCKGGRIVNLFLERK